MVSFRSPPRWAFYRTCQCQFLYSVLFTYLRHLDFTLGQDLLDALVVVGRSEFVLESGLGCAIHVTLSSLSACVSITSMEQRDPAMSSLLVGDHYLEGAGNLG